MDYDCNAAEMLNREPNSHAARFVAEHGPCAQALAWRVVDAQHTLRRALALGATAYGVNALGFGVWPTRS